MQKTILLTSKSMNGGTASQGTQGEYFLVPRTPGERETKLLVDAQRADKGPSEQRPGPSLLNDKEDSRDATIRRI